MAIYKSTIEWHDLRIAPDDFPEEGEDVLVTIENYEGSRRVLAGVYSKKLEDERYIWCMKDRVVIGRSYVEEIAVWEEVVAWAYYPAPHKEIY